MKYSITDYFGRMVQLAPRLGLYSVRDYAGTELPGLAVILDDVTNPDMPEQYCVLTVSFGDFIGMKNCAYIDTNNCGFADQLCEQGLGTNTGFTRQSGFCKYPLWWFDESTLKEIDSEIYQKYSDAYDEYMESMHGDNDDPDDGLDDDLGSEMTM